MLVAYSDSDSSGSSDIEHGSTRGTAVQRARSSKKGKSYKQVDRAQTNRIRVNIQAALASEDESEVNTVRSSQDLGDADAKHFPSRFNSLLPPPKKRETLENKLRTVTRSRGNGPGTLKTGATPTFSADESQPLPEQAAEDSVGQIEFAKASEGFHAPKSAPVPVLNSTMFKPLSVATRGRKKSVQRRSPIRTQTIKPATVADDDVRTMDNSSKEPKLSLFSLTEIEDDKSSHSQPVLRPEARSLISSSAEQGNGNQARLGILNTTPVAVSPSSVHVLSAGSREVDLDGMPKLRPELHQHQSPVRPTRHDLATVANDLHLSDAARRQLFGRRGRGSNDPNSAQIHVVNFNTDEEYTFNEALRANGVSAQPNPVRAIAPGKHSLKQLVNAASNQREALEEHFTNGKRIKRDAGSRYGW